MGIAGGLLVGGLLALAFKFDIGIVKVTAENIASRRIRWRIICAVVSAAALYLCAGGPWFGVDGLDFVAMVSGVPSWPFFVLRIAVPITARFGSVKVFDGYYSDRNDVSNFDSDEE